AAALDVAAGRDATAGEPAAGPAANAKGGAPGRGATLTDQGLRRLGSDGARTWSDPVHAAAGGSADLTVALRRKRRCGGGGHTDRRSQPARDRAADRLFRQHAGVGAAARGRSEFLQALATDAGRNSISICESGSALRKAGGGDRAPSRYRPHAAIRRSVCRTEHDEPSGRAFGTAPEADTRGGSGDEIRSVSRL